MPKLLIISALLMLSTAASAMNLVSNGKLSSVIVLGADASLAEKTAATELQNFIKQITKAEIPIAPTATSNPTRCRIFIGQTSITKALIPNFNWDSLKHDGILIKHINNDLILAGDRPRGTLYAVYDYLESLGVKFIAPDETIIPKLSTIPLPKADKLYVPKLRYREITYTTVKWQNPVYCARLRLSGYYHRIPEEYGGNRSIIGYCHTFEQFLPHEKYFASHPEWYSERDGKRVGSDIVSQLCLTNPEMKQELIKVVLDEITREPSAGMISVSQNDGGKPCDCASCRAEVARLGNQSDLLVQFVNDVAAVVEKQYPNFLVETLAYEYTRTPPKSVKPAYNVLIRLCTTGDCSKPLNSPANKSFIDDLTAWSAISDNLFVWDYVAGFANLHLPFPNIHVLAPNINTFIEYKSVGVHENGDFFNTSASMQPLKIYVMANLLWDPSQNTDKLTREFMDAYYGSAGKYLYSYTKLLEKSLQDHPTYLRWSNITTPFMTSDVLSKAFKLFNDAEKSVSNNQKLLKRVKIQRLSLEQAWVRSPLKVRDAIQPKAHTDDAKMVDDYIKLAEETGNVFMYEQGKMDWNELRSAAVGDTVANTNPAPGRVRNLPKTDWKEIRLGRVSLAAPLVATMVDDPDAVSGKAVRLDGSSSTWAAQFFLTPFDLRDFNRAEVIVSIKCTDKAQTGKAFTIGLHNLAENKFMPHHEFTLDEVKGDSYQEYNVGTYDLKEGMYIFIAPPGDAKLLSAMYIDRVYLVKGK